jgi:hypothetical protein
MGSFALSERGDATRCRQTSSSSVRKFPHCVAAGNGMSRLLYSSMMKHASWIHGSIARWCSHRMRHGEHIPLSWRMVRSYGRFGADAQKSAKRD